MTSESLVPGTRIRVKYNPGRVLELNYLGNNLYMVAFSQAGKLQKGDIINLTGMYVGIELLVIDVQRKGRSLGSYHAARDGGLTSVEIL